MRGAPGRVSASMRIALTTMSTSTPSPWSRNSPSCLLTSKIHLHIQIRPLILRIAGKLPVVSGADTDAITDREVQGQVQRHRVASQRQAANEKAVGTIGEARMLREIGVTECMPPADADTQADRQGVGMIQAPDAAHAGAGKTGAIGAALDVQGRVAAMFGQPAGLHLHPGQVDIGFEAAVRGRDRPGVLDIDLPGVAVRTGAQRGLITGETHMPGAVHALARIRDTAAQTPCRHTGAAVHAQPVGLLMQRRTPRIGLARLLAGPDQGTQMRMLAKHGIHADQQTAAVGRHACRVAVAVPAAPVTPAAEPYGGRRALDRGAGQTRRAVILGTDQPLADSLTYVAAVQRAD